MDLQPMPHPNGAGAALRAACEETETLPPEILQLCRAIRLGAPAPGLEGLRDERGKRTFRAEIHSGVATGKFVVKEFGARGPVDALFFRHLRPGPGRRYPHAAVAIREAGVFTPVIRFVASYDSPDGPRHLIGAEEIEGARMLGDVLAGLPAQERAGLFQLVGQAVARLHHAGIFHFDLTADNLLFRTASGCLIGPYLVDLDYVVRAPLRRRRICRVLACLDLHQFFTTRSVEFREDDRRMFEKGYRRAAGPAQSADWKVIHEASTHGCDASRAGSEAAAVAAAVAQPDSGPPRHDRPGWMRRMETSLIHLFRGALLVCRLVQ
jgi:tRNA A-37 threonylcarbamoyl transferase component Bud32